MNKTHQSQHISQDVYDYNKKKLCNLYDSSIHALGQAYSIVHTNDLNGWKTLTFNMPFVIDRKRNFRWNYIRSEYMLRLTRGDEVDWFIIHSPKQTKNRKAISNTVTCSHISSILKTKNLYMAFDDENGIGTLPYLMEQVLKGTGWKLGTCDTFYERDGKTEKIRSIKSEGKSGAYQLITNICNLFNAYPIYNGESKTVNIRSINHKGTLYEMTMGKDIESLTVAYNSEDIITRLYVEGDYGEDTYVGIDDVNPTGLTYLMNFDYYKKIGLFTENHQKALDSYYSEMKKAIEIIRAVSHDLNEKETSLNKLWGQIDYVFYPIVDGQVSKKIVGGNVTVGQLDIKEGDEITIIPENKLYRKVKAGANGSIPITKDDLYAIKFIKKPSAEIGAKEVAIEAKEKLIENLRNRVTDSMSDDKKADINQQIAKLESEIKDIYGGTKEEAGQYDLMTNASKLVMEMDALSYQRETALTRQENVEVDFVIAMGDMLKDGYWHNSNYSIGQERFLYEDALDMIEQMSKPSVSYSVSRISMSGVMGHPIVDYDQNCKIRIYDPDLNVNDFAYISGITSYLDSPEDDIVSISNEDITLSGLTLDSILSRITKLADLIDQKNSLYDRAEAISPDGSIYMERLEGQINVLKNQISSSVSNWYTDQNGNLVFESVNGKSAMMLCGEGFMIAHGKTQTGEWNWRTFGTGEGFTADAIVTGYLSADRIEARSITVNKLSSDVGQDLDLSSNKSIKLVVENTVAESIGTNLEIYLSANQPATQIYNSTLDTYVPDWSKESLVITPSVFANNHHISLSDPRVSVSWSRSVDGMEKPLEPSEASIDGKQVVSDNMKNNSIIYMCRISYKDGNISASRVAETGFALSIIKDGTDGSSGENAVSCSLSSDSIVFAANAIGQIAEQRRTIHVVAYNGTEKVSPIVSDIVCTIPGMTVTKEKIVNNEQSIIIHVDDKATLGTQNEISGTIDIPILSPANTILQINWSKVNSGSEGKQGIPGTNGIDGKTSYFHIKYSLLPNPTSPEDITETPSVYIGTYVDYIKEDSTNPLDYTWGRFQGNQGIAGTNGTNGETSYLHIKYSNDGGITFTPNQGEDAGSWIGQYVDFTPDDDINVSRYTWSKIQGTDGKPGESAVLLNLFTPDGSVFINGTGSLSIQAFAYLGAMDISNDALYSWYQYQNGDWNKLEEKSNTLIVSGEGIVGVGIFKCEMVYEDRTYSAISTLTDKTDNYQANISSTGGNIFVNGKGSSTLVCHIYQSGKEIDIGGRDYTYSWMRLNKVGETMDTSTFAVGKTITVIPANVPDIVTFVCDVSVGVTAQFTITNRNDIISSPEPPANPTQNMLWMDISDPDNNILKRWNGAEWIETTLSQSDINDIHTSISNQKSEIDQLSNAITLRVTQEQLNTGLNNKADADWVSKRQETLIEQTAENITQQFNQAKQFTVDSTSGFQDFIEEVKSYQRFSADGLELGVLNSPFLAKLGNTKLSFLQNGTEIAYISNNKLYITEAQVTNKLSIGTAADGIFDWITTSSGLGLKWKG